MCQYGGGALGHNLLIVTFVKAQAGLPSLEANFQKSANDKLLPGLIWETLY